MGKAAVDAGRPTPRVVAGVPVSVTADVDAAKDMINQTLQIYGTLPSYRAMLDKEGAAGPADVAILGDEENVLNGHPALRGGRRHRLPRGGQRRRLP